MAADWRVSHDLTFSIGAGYDDAHLTSDFLGPTSTTGVPTYFARSGDTIGGPPFTLTVSAEYHQTLKGNRELYERVDLQHLSEGAAIDYTVFGVDPLSRRSDHFEQVSLRVGLRLRTVDVSLFADNVLNQAPILSYQRDSTRPGDNLFTSTTIRPRTIGITGTVRY